MLSIRTIARSAPRTVSRLTGTSLRQSAIARSSAFIKPSTLSALRPARAVAFSTTVSRNKAASNETDEELLAKLESEIQIEEDIKANEQQPASIKDFLDNSPFELTDTPGQEVIKLTRSYNDEKITVTFSVSDLNNFDPFSEEDIEEEQDFTEEGKPINEAEDAEGGNTPINLTIIIEKPGKSAGALNIDAQTHDGNIVVENMYFYEDAKVARIDNPEAAQKRADIYPGPQFGSLDEDLQILTERFLEERGINQALAVFAPEYVDFKEQKEYLRWLNNVKTFVEA